VSYTYDGDGKRVKKSNGTLYWYGLGGEVPEETDLSGNLISDYMYFNGQRVVRRDAGGQTYAFLADPLGSTRMMTDGDGNIVRQADFYPFGGERVITSTVDTHYKFAGMERDAESSLDHTLYRQYSSSLGRWLSPDPNHGGCSNPQSLNRYAYVPNKPTTSTDPLGLLLVVRGCWENLFGWYDDEGSTHWTWGYDACSTSFYPDAPGGSGGGGGGGEPLVPDAVSKARSAAVDDIRNKKDCAALFGGASAADKLAKVTLAGADLGAPDVKSTPNGYKWDYMMARAVGNKNMILYNTNSNGFLDPQDITGYINGNKNQPVTIDALDSFNNNPAGPDASKLLGRDVTGADYQTFLMLHEFSHFQQKPNSNDFDKEIVSKCLK
jgi:RHS repeat-associated protein